MIVNDEKEKQNDEMTVNGEKENQNDENQNQND